MPQAFDFNLQETWEQNLARLKAYLAEIDPECATILFDQLAKLEADDPNARRDFNQKVLEAIEALADAELEVGTP